MIDNIIFKLYGYIEYLPVKAGFVTPVFLCDGQLYLEVVSNDFVVNFEKIPGHYIDLLKREIREFDIEVKINDSCCYGFKYNELLYYGNSKSMSAFFETITGEKNLGFNTKTIILRFIDKYKDTKLGVTSNCNEITKPENLIKLIQRGDNAVLERVYSCFFKLYFKQFKLIAQEKILYRYPVISNRQDEITTSAFIESLLILIQYLKREELYSKASISTVFHEIYRRRIYALIKESTQKRIEFQELDSEAISESDYFLSKEREEIFKYKQEILTQAFALLSERDANIIRWRKLEKLSIQEIAMRLNLKPSSIHNEVYMSLEKLKRILLSLTEENRSNRF